MVAKEMGPIGCGNLGDVLVGCWSEVSGGDWWRRLIFWLWWVLAVVVISKSLDGGVARGGFGSKGVVGR